MLQFMLKFCFLTKYNVQWWHVQNFKPIFQLIFKSPYSFLIFFILSLIHVFQSVKVKNLLCSNYGKFRTLILNKLILLANYFLVSTILFSKPVTRCTKSRICTSLVLHNLSLALKEYSHKVDCSLKCTILSNK